MQHAEGESIISVLADVGRPIPLHTLPNQELVAVFTAMTPSTVWVVVTFVSATVSNFTEEQRRQNKTGRWLIQGNLTTVNKSLSSRERVAV